MRVRNHGERRDLSRDRASLARPVPLESAAPCCPVDCNNVYVACERLFQPALEWRVVVLSNYDGCIIARSHEAKARGG